MIIQYTCDSVFDIQPEESINQSFPTVPICHRLARLLVPLPVEGVECDPTTHQGIVQISAVLKLLDALKPTEDTVNANCRGVVLLLCKKPLFHGLPAAAEKMGCPYGF